MGKMIQYKCSFPLPPGFSIAKKTNAQYGLANEKKRVFHNAISLHTQPTSSLSSSSSLPLASFCPGSLLELNGIKMWFFAKKKQNYPEQKFGLKLFIWLDCYRRQCRRLWTQHTHIISNVMFYTCVWDGTISVASIPRIGRSSLLLALVWSPAADRSNNLPPSTF